MGFARLEGFNGSLADVSRGVKIRLAAHQIGQFSTTGFQPPRFIPHLRDGGGNEIGYTGGNKFVHDHLPLAYFVDSFRLKTGFAKLAVYANGAVKREA